MATQKDVQVCIKSHFDAVALWIRSFGGEDSPATFARRVRSQAGGAASDRLLQTIRDHHDLGRQATRWKAARGRDDNKGRHEIGIHGYTHEIRSR